MTTERRTATRPTAAPFEQETRCRRCQSGHVIKAPAGASATYAIFWWLFGRDQLCDKCLEESKP